MNRALNMSRAGSVLVVMFLVGCGTSSVPDNPNAGRYSIKQDRAPTRSLNERAIADVQPEPVQRTMAGNRSPYTVLGGTYHVLPTEAGYKATGVASWYGEKFHGHRTSNGEIFDMYQVSAAHKSLPIPSFARVTNLDNNRSIIVRVNDRGPFHGDRLIDLSYAAAVKLGYADRGTARVAVEGIVANSWQDSATNDSFSTESGNVLRVSAQENHYLQVGAFAELSSARRLSNQLQDLTTRPVIIRTVESGEGSVLHRVRIGPLRNSEEIRQLTASVVAANLGSPYTVTE